MYVFYCLLAVAAGALSPLQAGINAQLRSFLHHPLLATLASVIVSFVAVFVVCLVLKTPMPSLSQLQAVPSWAWLGGVVGVIYIGVSLWLVPKLGASALVASLIGGQLLCSLLLDQFGLVGFPQHSLNAGRLIGIALLIAGVLLIERY